MSISIKIIGLEMLLSQREGVGAVYITCWTGSTTCHIVVTLRVFLLEDCILLSSVVQMEITLVSLVATFTMQISEKDLGRWLLGLYNNYI